MCFALPRLLWHLCVFVICHPRELTLLCCFRLVCIFFFSNSPSVLLCNPLPTLNELTGTDADVIDFKCDVLTHVDIFMSPSAYIFKYLLFLCYTWPWKWTWLVIKHKRVYWAASHQGHPSSGSYGGSRQPKGELWEQLREKPMARGGFWLLPWKQMM